jgi:5-oxoprolinase (ATP-hydrolysing)
VPDYFPKIFGPKENEPLDANVTESEFKKLATVINSFLNFKAATDEVASHELSLDEIAYGFVQVANEAMCRPIRALTQGKGHAAKNHILACFGGAGGQHAFAIAKALGISKILIHKHSSILSAYGLALADVILSNNRLFMKRRSHVL